MLRHQDNQNPKIQVDNISIYREGDTLRIFEQENGQDSEKSLDAVGAYMLHYQDSEWVLSGGEGEYDFAGWHILSGLTHQDAEEIARVLKIGLVEPEKI